MKIQNGFTLVELMVGIVISLLVSVSVMGTAKYLENQKRVNVGVNGALETLTIESGNISNEIRMAGFGMVYGGNFQCTKSQIKKNGINAVTDANGFLPPIQIVDGGDGKSDTIRVVYADSPVGISRTTLNVALGNFTQPTYIAATGVSTIVDYALPFSITESISALNLSSVMIINAAAGGICEVVSSVSATGFPQSPTTAAPIGSVAVPITGFQDVTYRVAGGKLIRHDNFVAGVAGDAEIEENVVFMKAYGLVQDTWFKAGDLTAFTFTPSLGTQLTTTAPTAIKLFLVVREQNFSKKQSGACTETTQTSLNESLPWFVAGATPDPAVDLTAIADWDCYKYKAVELVVPLKNLILGKS
jgi:type IV pilus assembly protein PilW